MEPRTISCPCYGGAHRSGPLAWAVFVITLAALPRRCSLRLRSRRTQICIAQRCGRPGVSPGRYRAPDDAGRNPVLHRCARRSSWRIISSRPLIWRWAVVFGFLAAVLARHRPGQIIFLAILAIIFLQGDRTIRGYRRHGLPGCPRFQDKKLAQDLMRIAFNYNPLSYCQFS